ncbi:MAG TPA: hypothetical protein DCR44_00210 [Acholeplasmatales bacterium]|nr:MAG: hypothetical protein A2Y16_05010 [Tenericutes bacterium GWF2_57_13]HAQ55827.1 hypothetical protein [Acholeplasmatales bacterium]
MVFRFRKDVARRRAEKIRYFFRAVGMHIRKRRKALKMTQESLSKGICSNTYISKMETNSIAVNEDSLMLVMERMELSYSLEMNVDEQLNLFDRALDAFLAGNYEEVEKVGYEVRNVTFAILTDLCRLVRDIVRGSAKDIVSATDNLSRCLDSMDHHAFGVFMFYAAAGLVAIDRPGDAIDLLEEFETTEYASIKLGPMIQYLKAVGYGRTGRYGKAYDAIRAAETAFLNQKNYRRLAELAVIRMEIDQVQGHPIAWDDGSLLEVLDPCFRDRYHLLRAKANIDPKTEVGLIRPASRHRGEGLFLIAGFCRKSGDEAGFRVASDELNAIEKRADALDYAKWLERLGAGDEVAYKDYLIAEVLPYAEQICDFSLLNRATDQITAILVKRKRYKDALQYAIKARRFMRTVAKAFCGEMPDELPEDDESKIE